MIHRKTSSVGDLMLKSKLDQLIKDCQKTKKEIHLNSNKISQKLTSQKNQWKNIENYLKEQKIKYKSGFIESQELRGKYRALCEKQNDKRIRKLSKFFYFNKDDLISENEVVEQGTKKFFSDNKRNFGSGLKGISLNKPKKIESCNISISPDTTNFFNLCKPKIPKLVGFQSDNEADLNQLSSKEKIILKELKKIESRSIFSKRRNQVPLGKGENNLTVFSRMN